MGKTHSLGLIGYPTTFFCKISSFIHDLQVRNSWQPPLSTIRAAVEALEARGENSGYLQSMVDQLIEMKPGLAKEG